MTWGSMSIPTALTNALVSDAESWPDTRSSLPWFERAGTAARGRWGPLLVLRPGPGSSKTRGTSPGWPLPRPPPRTREPENSSVGAGPRSLSSVEPLYKALCGGISPVPHRSAGQGGHMCAVLTTSTASSGARGPGGGHGTGSGESPDGDHTVTPG